MCYQVIPGMTCQNQKDKGRNEITEALHKKSSVELFCYPKRGS